MTHLAEYLRELKSLKKEQPIEPELKQGRKEFDRKIKEDQDLRSGVVLEVTLTEGSGGGAPQEGDLVYVHCVIKDLEDDVLFSTRTEDGGGGQPLVFMLGKGERAPRGWELALLGMTQGQRKMLKIAPAYGFAHPECQMSPPAGVPMDVPLAFDLELVAWQPASQVYFYKLPGEEREPGSTPAPSSSGMYKLVLEEGRGWENPRAPCEVTFRLVARLLAYNGTPQTGFTYYDSGHSGEDGCLRVQLGAGSLPEGVESALGLMCREERALVIVPASSMEGKGGPGGPCLIPPPPGRGTRQVELDLEVVNLTQIRDMTGSGEVIKKRVRAGNGEFPMDCPVTDATVRVHYRARKLHRSWPQGSGAFLSLWVDNPGALDEDWVYDSRRDGNGAVVEVDTGCGELPEGLELVIKLMVPGEVARAQCTHRYAYEGREDCPQWLDGDKDDVEFEVELVEFDREGHWQVMTTREKIGTAEKQKAKANQLFKSKKYTFAFDRYDRLYRLLETTREFDTEEELQQVNALKQACLRNLALVSFQLEEYAQSIEYCDKALQYDENDAKVIFRRGKARMYKGDFEEAEKDLVMAKELDEGIIREVDAALLLNRQRQKAAAEKQKQQFKNFFQR